MIVLKQALDGALFVSQVFVDIFHEFLHLLLIIRSNFRNLLIDPVVYQIEIKTFKFRCRFWIFTNFSYFTTLFSHNFLIKQILAKIGKWPDFVFFGIHVKDFIKIKFAVKFIMSDRKAFLLSKKDILGIRVVSFGSC